MYVSRLVDLALRLGLRRQDMRWDERREWSDWIRADASSASRDELAESLRARPVTRVADYILFLWWAGLAQLARAVIGCLVQSVYQGDTDKFHQTFWGKKMKRRDIPIGRYYYVGPVGSLEAGHVRWMGVMREKGQLFVHERDVLMALALRQMDALERALPDMVREVKLMYRQTQDTNICLLWRLPETGSVARMGYWFGSRPSDLVVSAREYTYLDKRMPACLRAMMYDLFHGEGSQLTAGTDSKWVRFLKKYTTDARGEEGGVIERFLASCSETRRDMLSEWFDRYSPRDNQIKALTCRDMDRERMCPYVEAGDIEEAYVLCGKDLGHGGKLDIHTPASALVLALRKRCHN